MLFPDELMLPQNVIDALVLNDEDRQHLAAWLEPARLEPIPFARPKRLRSEGGAPAPVEPPAKKQTHFMAMPRI